MRRSLGDNVVSARALCAVSCGGHGLICAFATALYVTLLVSSGMAAAQCGDGIVEAGEECDDGGLCIGGLNAGTYCNAEADCLGEGVCDTFGTQGSPGTIPRKVCSSDSECGGARCIHCKTFGGDGCAANCTAETDSTVNLVPGALTGSDITPGTSGEVLRGDILTVPLTLSGTNSLIAGKPGPTGLIPLAQKATGISLPRIPVSTLACACVRGSVYKTCGGTQFEADGFTVSPNCTLPLCSVTKSMPCLANSDCPTGETCVLDACAGKKPCTEVAGPGNAGEGVIGCGTAGLPSVNYSVVQDTGGSTGIVGPAIFTPGAGGPAGSQILASASAIGTVVGLCSDGTPAYGTDGEYCTDDDPFSSRGVPSVTTLVTGTASAAVKNANQVDGDDIGPFGFTGNAIGCDKLAAGNRTGLGTAGAFTNPRQPTFGDIVVTTQLVSQSSQVVTPTSTPSPSGHPAMQIGTASGAHGQQVAFAVILHAGGAQVAGTQNDIAFDGTNIRIAAKANGKPDCTVNGEIHKGATSFAFRPNGCGGASCTSIRANVLSTDNVDQIPDGTVLYTCNANIAAGAADGQYPLSISGVILSDPNGNQIPGSTGINGKIIVNSSFTPTPTPTRTPTKTPTPTRTAIPQVSLNVGSATGARGQQTTFSVTLRTGTAQVAATQNDLTFDSGNIPIAANASGKPDCTVNPDIGKEATSFAFEPTGCSGTTCASVRVIAVSVANTDSIPDGSVVYTCRVNISANAPFITYPLNIGRIVASDALGNSIAATGASGSVAVNRFAPTTTPTPTPTVSPVRPVIALGSAMAPPGNQRAEFGVFLNTMGAQVAATQVDIIFDPSTPVGANADGSPQCTVNPNILKGGTNFHFQPANCVPGANCGAVRAIVIAFDNADPIPNGATLFTCTDAIKRTALTQQYVLTCSGAQATDSSAHRLPAACTNGAITVTMPCVGDCNGDGEVTIDELLTGVGIGLGSIQYDQCPAFDADRNQSLTIDELLQGVLDGLNACPVSQ